MYFSPGKTSEQSVFYTAFDILLQTMLLPRLKATFLGSLDHTGVYSTGIWTLAHAGIYSRAYSNILEFEVI